MLNNPFSMVVAIVAIVGIASIIRARYGFHPRDEHRTHHALMDHGQADALDKQRLHDEVEALKERVEVLERTIATLRKPDQMLTARRTGRDDSLSQTYPQSVGDSSGMDL